MHQQNLSTLTSKKPGSDWMPYLRTAAWALFFLAITDVLVNLLFAYPYRSQQAPNALQQYFEYGRSTEGTIRQMVAPTDKKSAPITQPGWLGDNTVFAGLPTELEDGKTLFVATYGGSFNQRVSRAIERNYEDSITLRAVGAPGGPLNWAYTAYQLDRSQHQADVTVLTLISFTAAKYTMGGQFGDLQAPYTRPLYFLEGNEIQKVNPEVTSLPELRTAIYDESKLWESHVQKLAQYDPYYKPLLFDQSILDLSSIMRMLRRWHGKNFEARVQDEFYDTNGFKPDSETVQVMKALVKDFAASAREDGILPIVYLANTQGWGSHLYEVLYLTLEENDIPYVSSHLTVPTDNPRLFLSDGHYIQEKDEELAESIIQLIQKELSLELVPEAKR